MSENLKLKLLLISENFYDQNLLNGLCLKYNVLVHKNSCGIDAMESMKNIHYDFVVVGELENGLNSDETIQLIKSRGLDKMSCVILLKNNKNSYNKNIFDFLKSPENSLDKIIFNILDFLKNPNNFKYSI